MNKIEKLDNVLNNLRGRFATVRTRNAKGKSVFCGRLEGVSNHTVRFFDRNRGSVRRVYKTSIQEVSSGSNRFAV